MKIASVQYPIRFFVHKSEWQQSILSHVQEACKNQAHLLVFPEYGSMDLCSLIRKNTAELTENKDSLEAIFSENSLSNELKELQLFLPEFRNFFSELAKKFSLYILAPSFPVAESGKYINRAFFYNPKGHENFQDKLMMTRFENEEWKISAGDKKLKVFITPYGSIGIQICYDSEFPLFSSLLAKQGCQIILVPSCTEGLAGATRIHISSRARAIENQLYTVVSQTVQDCTWNQAVDKNYGYAAFYSPAEFNFPIGGILVQGEPQKEGLLVQDLDLKKITTVRSQGQVFNFKDNQSLNQNTNGYVIEEISF